MRPLLLRLLLIPLMLFVAYDLSASELSPGTQCDSICGPAESCDTECQNDLFETTCGAYNGGSSGGMCLGYCGDNYCNSYNNEDSTSCSEDCSSCTPNYVPIDEDILGAAEFDVYPYYCDLNVFSVITYGDANSCSGSSNYQACLYYNWTTVPYPPSAGYCCATFGCGGTFTCPL